MTTISLVLNTYNEAKNIARAIESAPGVDEIVVADMESTDNTVAIAQSLGARILHLPNAGFCEPGRQPAIDFATSEWVLILDGDERLSPNGVTSIRQLIADTPQEISGWNVELHTFLGAFQVRSTGWDPQYEQHVRLFRRNEITWPMQVHAVPELTQLVSAVPKEYGIWIDHDNFADLTDVISNFNEYSSIIAKDKNEKAETFSIAHGLRDGINEFLRRYNPEVDQAASFALSIGLLLHRVLDNAKAIEMNGWDSDPLLPSSESMTQAWSAFWQSFSQSELAHLSRIASDPQLADDEAFALIQKANELYGANADLAQAVARRYISLDKLEDAVNVISEGLQLDPHHAGLLDLLREIETRLVQVGE